MPLTRLLGHLRGLRLSAIPFLALSLLPATLWAHGGIDHGEDAGAAAIHRTAAPRFSATGDAVEVVGILYGEQLRLYVDDRASNRPLEGAKVEIELDGRPLPVKPLEDGSYGVPAGALQRGQDNSLVITVTGPVEDLLIGNLHLPASGETPASTGKDSRLAVGVITFIILALVYFALRGAGRSAGDRGLGLFDLLALVAVLALSLLVSRQQEAVKARLADWFGLERPAAARTEQEGPSLEVASQRLPDGTVFIPKPGQRMLGLHTLAAEAASGHRPIELPARVIADPARSSDVAATIEGQLVSPEDGFPTLGSKVEKGQVLAYLTPVLSPLEETQRYVDINNTERSLYVSKVKLQRLDPRGEIDLDTPTDNALVDSTRMDVRTEQKNKKALEAIFSAKVPLRAPVAGSLASAQVSQGALVQTGQPLFRVVDPDALWIEATYFGSETLPPEMQARARLADGRLIDLHYLGASPELSGLGKRLQFRVDEPPAGLAAGAVAEVLIDSNEPVEGVAVPAGSVVLDAAGRTVVWVHEAAERFAPVPVDTTPVASGEVLVTSGLDDEARVLAPTSVPLINGVR